MRFGVLYLLRRRDVCFASDVQLCLVTLFAAGEKLMKEIRLGGFLSLLLYFAIGPVRRKLFCGLLYSHPTPSRAREGG